MYSDTLTMYHFDSRNNVLVEGYGAGSTPGRPRFESRDDITNIFSSLRPLTYLEEVGLIEANFTLTLTFFFI